MKPHEIIETIITTACRMSFVQWEKAFKRSPCGRFTNKGEQYTNVRMIIATMVAKYLGRDHACEIMDTDSPTLSKYETEHRREMFDKKRVYNITNEIKSKLTLEKHKAADNQDIIYKRTLQVRA